MDAGWRLTTRDDAMIEDEPSARHEQSPPPPTPPRTPPLDQVCGSLLVDPGHYDLGLRLKIQGGRFCLLGYCRVALASETAAASAKGAFFLSCSPPPAGVCACCRRR